MPKLILIMLLTLSAVGLQSAADDSGTVKTGDWEYNSQVQKIADTPLGALYCIDNSDTPFLHYPDCKCELCQKNFKVCGLLQFSFLKKNEMNKRFVVVDFSIRACPAFDNQAMPAFAFDVLRSAKSEVDGYYKEFNGKIEVESDRLFFFDSIFTDPKNKNPPAYKTDPHYVSYRPDFEPLHFRIIFDTVSAKHLVFYYNRQKIILLNPEFPMGKIEFRNVSITIPKSGNHRYRDRYLEISRPVVRQFDTEKEMDDKLDAIQFFPYRYEALLAGYLAKNKDIKWVIRQAKQHKNPDVLYACAQMLLYGKDDVCDPETAVDLLKELATKDNHVLAKYDLALCYYRGYGVEKDEKAAFRYVKDALKFHYKKAAALYMLMRYDQLNRPIFMQEKTLSDFKEQIDSAVNVEHDLTVMNDLFSLDAFNDLVAVSPKNLNAATTFFHLSDADKNDDPYSFFDACIAKGYYPGYLFKARRVIGYEKDFPSSTSIPELLEQGTQKGDQDAAIVRLFWRAQNKQLAADDFSQKQLLWLQNYPEFYLLQFIYQNPDFPAAKEIIISNREASESILSKVKQPEAKYLLGLTTVSKTILGNRRVYLKPDSAKFKYLIDAAKTDYPAAKYFLARAYYNNDMPEDYQKTMAEESRLYQARQLLKQAAAADFLPAQYMLLQLELDTTTVGMDQYLQRVQTFCDLDYAPAFLLKAQALQKIKRLDEAKQAYLVAAEKGNVDAYSALALITKDNKELWLQYIQGDMRRRTYDKMDFFYPEIEYYVWVKTIGYTWNDELVDELQKRYSSLSDSKESARKEGEKRSKSSTGNKDKNNNNNKKPNTPTPKTQPFIKNNLL